MAGLPLYPTEARILAKYVLSVKPNAKVAILYQNDDFGRDFLGPFKKVLEDAGGSATVVAEATYDLTDPTVDSQLINLSKSGADVFYNISTGKASSQSIRKVAELGWKPLQLLSAGSTGRSILSAAGFENAAGIVAIRYSKEAGVPRWQNDPDVMGFEELRKKYLPNVDPDNTIAYAGYGQAVTMAEILRRCGDDLTRANVLKQATMLNGFHSPFMLDGVTYSFTPDDYTPMKTLFISIFDGKDWIISDNRSAPVRTGCPPPTPQRSSTRLPGRRPPRAHRDTDRAPRRSAPLARAPPLRAVPAPQPNVEHRATAGKPRRHPVGATPSIRPEHHNAEEAARVPCGQRRRVVAVRHAVKFLQEVVEGAPNARGRSPGAGRGAILRSALRRGPSRKVDRPRGDASDT